MSEQFTYWKYSDIPMPTGCWVYHLMQGDTVVYVGMTKNGISRVASHLVEGHKKFDGLRAYPCKTRHEAAIKEGEDIWKYDPIYNCGGATNEEYANRTYFSGIKWIRPMTLDAYLSQFPHIKKCGVKFWHKKHKYPEGHRFRAKWDNLIKS